MQYLEGSAFLDIAVRHALGIPQQRRDVPVRFMLDAGKLRARLGSHRAENDHGPQGAQVAPHLARPRPKQRRVLEPARRVRWQLRAIGRGPPAGRLYAGRRGQHSARHRRADPRNGQDVSLALIETPAPPLSLDDSPANSTARPPTSPASPPSMSTTSHDEEANRRRCLLLRHVHTQDRPCRRDHAQTG